MKNEEHTKPSERTIVFLVDDDTPTLEVYDRLLQAAGYHVELSVTGTYAIERIREILPQIVLCGVSLPDLSGLEVLKRVKEDPATASCLFVLMSPHRHAHTRQVKEEGKAADGYLVKPENCTDITGWLDAFLKQKGAEMALRLDEQSRETVGKSTEPSPTEKNVVPTNDEEIPHGMPSGEGIRVNESTIRQIFDSLNEAIMIHDARTRTRIDMNARAVEMYGYDTKEEILARSIGELSAGTPPFSNEEAMQHINRAMTEGPQTFEWLAKRRSGELFWAEVSLRFTDLDGDQRIISVIRDISDRKRQEDYIRILNDRLMAVYKAGLAVQTLQTPSQLATGIFQVLGSVVSYDHGAVLLLAEDGVTIDRFAISVHGKQVNDITREQFLLETKTFTLGRGIVGWVLSTGKSMRIGDVTKEPDYIGILDDIRSELCVPILVDGKVFGAINLETTLPDAYSEMDEHILETMAMQIGIAIQNANLYHLTRKEVQERIQAEERLRRINDELDVIVQNRTAELNEQLRKQEKSQKAMLFMVEDLNSMTSDLKTERQNLQAMNKELESFSYSVSHDLRAPLRAIDGFTRILVEEHGVHLSSEAQRLCGIIRENTRRMGQLIDDLLGFARLGRAEMTKTTIGMKALVMDVIMDQVPEDIRKRVLIRVDDIESAWGDPAMIRQVWINLIANAIKFSTPRDHPEITVSSRIEGGFTEYCVSDNGVGFDMKYVDKLFGVFQRLHSIQQFEGTGVGLAIVHRVVSKHGGTVRAEGEPDKGARFYFTLPHG